MRGEEKRVKEKNRRGGEGREGRDEEARRLEEKIALAWLAEVRNALQFAMTEILSCKVPYVMDSVPSSYINSVASMPVCDATTRDEKNQHLNQHVFVAILYIKSHNKKSICHNNEERGRGRGGGGRRGREGRIRKGGGQQFFL